MGTRDVSRCPHCCLRHMIPASEHLHPGHTVKEQKFEEEPPPMFTYKGTCTLETRFSFLQKSFLPRPRQEGMPMSSNT